MHDKHINYSQCWEDPRVLIEGLSIGPDDHVFSITSGGDNTLAIALARPQSIDSIDVNPAQNHLLELKLDSAVNLPYAQFLELMGVTSSLIREQLFEKVCPTLSSGARAWWLAHTDLIKVGVTNCGRFERFTRFFAQKVIPLVHSNNAVKNLLNCHTILEQREFYKKHWNSWRWRLLFRVASSRLILRLFARQKRMFAQLGGETGSSVYLKRLVRHLNSVPIAGNFFMHYSLMGKYGKELPPYLEYANYGQLQRVLRAPENLISIVTCDILTHLRSQPDGAYSKFNLSDIFEGLSPESNEAVWQEIIRTSKPGAVVVYWNNLVSRTYPTSIVANIRTDEKRLSELRASDRVFFYDTLYVHTIIK